MATKNQDPSAGATPGAAQEPGAAAVASGAGDNLTGAELAAVFAKRRTASRAASAPGSKSQDAESAQPGASAPAAAPAAETKAPPDKSNAGSAPETESDTTTGLSGPEPEPEPKSSEALGEPEGEGEPGGEADLEPEPEPAEEPRSVREMRKRIDTLTARLRQAEAERDELKEKVSASQPAEAAQPPATGTVYAHDPELKQIGGEIDKWRRVEQWLARNPAGGEITDGEGKILHTVSEEQAEALRAEAADKLADLRALKAVRERELKRQDAEDRARSEALLMQRFPWAKDPKAPGSQLMAAIKARVPGIEALPGWRLYAAYAWEGASRDAEKSAGKGPGPNGASGGGGGGGAARPPKVAVPGGGAGARLDPVRRELAEAEAAFEKSGSTTDLARVQKLRRQLRASARA